MRAHPLLAGRALLWAALALFAAHSLAFLGYFNDDAFITFACAKTLAETGRFAIDRFAEIAEASSAPLWALLLAGLHALGLPIPPAAKCLNALFSLATLALVFRIGRGRRDGGTDAGPDPIRIGPLLLALTSGFVVWSAAGLENPLLELLVAGLVLGSLNLVAGRGASGLTVSAALVGLVRPEGPLYALAAYASLLPHLRANARDRSAAFLSFAFVACLQAAFFLARFSRFAWPFPNTYYAKIGAAPLDNLASGLAYLAAFAIRHWPLLLLPLLFRGRTADPAVARPAAFLLAANLLFVAVVGGTWGDTRFLSPLLVALVLLAQEGVRAALQAGTPRRTGRIVALIVALHAVQMAGASQAARLRPIVPAAVIQRTHAALGNEVGRYLIANGYRPNAKHVPYLVPDIGATAYCAEHYTVVDLAGLGNVPLAHHRYEREFFAAYVFGEVRPALIETHDGWSERSAIGSFPEFSADYAPLRTLKNDPDRPADLPKGYYIRKDLFAVGAPAGPEPPADRPLEPCGGCAIEAGPTAAFGELRLTIDWRCRPADGIRLDRHLTTVFLRRGAERYPIDTRKIAGGYFPLARLDGRTAVRDRRRIDLPRAFAGDYTVEIEVTYLDGPVEAFTLGSVELAAATADEKRRAVAAGEMKRRMRLDLVASQAEPPGDDPSGPLLESIAALAPLSGTVHPEPELDAQLHRAEVALADRLEAAGRDAEAHGNAGAAIEWFERALWFDLDRAWLRRHVELIRPKGR